MIKIGCKAVAGLASLDLKNSVWFENLTFTIVSRIKGKGEDRYKDNDKDKYNDKDRVKMKWW